MTLQLPRTLVNVLVEEREADTKEITHVDSGKQTKQTTERQQRNSL